MMYDNEFPGGDLDTLFLAIGEDGFEGSLLSVLRRVANVDHIMIFSLAGAGSPSLIASLGSVSAAASSLIAEARLDMLVASGADGSTVARDARTSGRFARAEARQGRGRRRAAGHAGITIELDTVALATEHGDAAYELRCHRVGEAFTDQQIHQLNRYARALRLAVFKHCQLSDKLGKADQHMIGRILIESWAFDTITFRERLVCIGILGGHTSESIAINLNISVNSVLTYRKRLYRKLGITSQNELFIRVLQSACTMQNRRSGLSVDKCGRRLTRADKPLAVNWELAQTYFSDHDGRRTCHA